MNHSVLVGSARSIVFLAAAIFLVQQAGGQEVDGGNKIILEFPKLPVDRSGQPAKTTIWLPKDYRPEGVYPLYVWLGAADGVNQPVFGKGVVKPAKFVQLALPYPKGANNPGFDKAVGDFPTIWKYHQAMLDEVLRAVPNIHPRMRVIAGFSNGGHCIDGLLSVPDCDFRKTFNVFVLADGGAGIGDYRGLENSFAYVCWGEKSPQKAASTLVVKKATEAKMTVKAEEMSGLGHAFPPAQRKVANRWIDESVLPAVALRELALAEKAIVAGRFGDAMQALRGIETMAIAGSDDKVQGLISKCEKRASEEWQAHKAKLASPPTDKELVVVQHFRLKCNGTKAAAEAMVLALPRAEKELDSLKRDLRDPAKMPAAVSRLRQMEQEWLDTKFGRECWNLAISAEERVLYRLERKK